MSQQHTGALFALVSAAGFATLAVLVKIAYAAGATAVTILTVRFVIAAVFLWLAVKWQGPGPALSWKHKLQLGAMGVFGYGVMSFTFTMTLQYLSASLTAMLLYTYPALVSLLSFALGDDKPTYPKISALIISFIGLVLVLGVSGSGINLPGIALGLSSAIVYSGYIVAGNRLLKNVNPLVATAYVCSSAGLAFLIFGTVTSQLAWNLTGPAWLAILGIVIFPTVIAIMSFFAGLSRIGATNISIISTLEPVITVILSAGLLAERITLVQAGGGILIIMGVIILQLKPDLISRTATADQQS